MDPHPYRQAFAARDLDGVVALLADDVVFHSPVIAAPGFEGRDSVAELHTIIFDALDDVDYTHELANDGTRVLVANASMLGRPFKATMLLELNAAGKIREIWVMVRPLTGAVAIAEAIGSRLTQRQAPRRVRVTRALSKTLAGLAALLDRNGSRLIGALNRSIR